MIASNTCAIAADGESAERYVAGTLPDEGGDAFEIHLLSCAACQRTVREAAALRAAGLAATPVSRRRIWPLAAAGALAAALVAVLLLPRESAIQRLGRVDAPIFEGTPVRGVADSASLLAESAMRDYRSRRYRSAAQQLERAASLDPSAALSFYLGLSRLLSGDAEGALSPLRQASADVVYGAESELYLAKAWLRLEEVDSARGHARLAAISGGSVARWAEALLDSMVRAERP